MLKHFFSRKGMQLFFLCGMACQHLTCSFIFECLSTNYKLWLNTIMIGYLDLAMVSPELVLKVQVW